MIVYVVTKKSRLDVISCLGVFDNLNLAKSFMIKQVKKEYCNYLSITGMNYIVCDNCTIYDLSEQVVLTDKDYNE